MISAYCFALALLFQVLIPEDWTEFRGPKSNGHVEGTTTPLQWSDTDNLCWKTPIPGLGWSSPVIAKGVVYLTTAVEENGKLSLRALAIDARSGEVLWNREIRSVQSVPPIHKKNSHASPTPILRDDSVFVHFGALGMARLGLDGNIQWTNFEIDYPPVHGSGGSPVFFDNKLFIVCDGSSNCFVAAIDAKTGKFAWRTPRSVQPPISHSFVTPMIATFDGRAQLMAPGPDHFAAYDPKDGRELWRIRAPGWSVVPQPTVGHGLVIYNHDYDHPELIAARLGGSGDVTESHIAWRIKRGAPSTPTPLLIGDELYFVSDDGIASCVNAKTGDQIWMERLGGNFSSSPVYVNELILFMNEDGIATWIKPGKQYQIVQRNEISGRTFATPSFADGAMYLRTDEHLLKYSER